MRGNSRADLRWLAEAAALRVDGVHALHRLLRTVALVVRHERELIVVELGHLQRAVRHVRGVEQHERGGRVVPLHYPDQLTLVEELGVIGAVEGGGAVVRLPVRVYVNSNPPQYSQFLLISPPPATEGTTADGSDATPGR